MYDIIYRLLGFEFPGTNTTSYSQTIFYICGAIALIVLVSLIDLVYRAFRHFWR